MRRRTFSTLAAIWIALAGARPAAAQTPPILTDDVARFYAVYEAADGKPEAEVLQREYLDRGTPALHELARQRNVTAARLAEAIARRPEIYQEARRCLAVLPAVRERLTTAFARLTALHPEARLPPVTIVVGRGRPVGMTDAAGVTIGLEALCAADFMHPDVEDRFVHVITHEYAHIQQPPELQLLEPGRAEATVLRMSLMEGAAEFVGELISGRVGQHQHAEWTRGKEAEIEAAFVRDQDKIDLSAWLYNGPGDADRPSDLGYWVGYRIARAYYANASDKRQALKDILEMRDPKAFLARSGWRPAAGPD